MNPKSYNTTDEDVVHEPESDFKRKPSGLRANRGEGRGVEMRNATGPQFKVLKVKY